MTPFLMAKVAILQPKAHTRTFSA